MTARPAELLAELAGTAFLIFMGLSAEAQTATAPDGSLGGAPTVAVAWGVAVMVACIAFGRTSGAHINPAVTLALAAEGRFPWRKVIPYCAAQLVGGFLGALAVRGLTVPLINRFDPELTSRSQGVFSTLPGAEVPHFFALANEMAGTAVLVIALLVLLDRAADDRLLAALEPALIGLVVTGIGLSMGSMSSWAINPARDLPPRLVEALTGYSTAWQDQNGAPYWWVPIIGPLAGCLVGVVLYRLPSWVRPLLDPQAAGIDAARTEAAENWTQDSPLPLLLDDTTEEQLAGPWSALSHAAALRTLIPPELVWRGSEGLAEVARLEAAFEAGLRTRVASSAPVTPQTRNALAQLASAPTNGRHPVPTRHP